MLVRLQKIKTPSEAGRVGQMSSLLLLDLLDLYAISFREEGS